MADAEITPKMAKFAGRAALVAFLSMVIGITIGSLAPEGFIRTVEFFIAGLSSAVCGIAMWVRFSHWLPKLVGLVFIILAFVFSGIGVWSSF